ncbi:MAG TPA: hybrid sensor histidine kinase/response regulator, partial [Spirochaetota bacterium]|nr:hybrid sensor histidine kinase/response regulator [Spirochaetota bacterium]
MDYNFEKKSKTILYIEDEPTNRLLLKKILEPKGYKIFEAEDGLSGIEIALKEKIDLILLDINMAGMNGYEIATRIKNTDKIKDIQLVAFTANVMKRSREKALISGCDGYLTKPIDGNNFVIRLEEYLNGKKDFIPQDMIPELMKEYNVQLVEHLEKEIRELKRANDDLKQLDKLKSDFISIASHELRTPLVTIIGYVGLLLSKRLGHIEPEHEKILKVVERNSKRLERIVKDIFTLSLIENQIPFMEIRNTNPINIIESILEDVALVLAEREIEAKLNIEGEIPTIECDEDKISQTISNIMNNAIKFTQNGGVIDVSVKYPSLKVVEKFGLDPTLYVEIKIEDTGIGIPKDKLNKVFEKFVELADIEKHHSSETEFMGGGTGLGLSICKGIVEKHNGFIWAENREVKGTSMMIILPLKIKDHL